MVVNESGESCAEVFVFLEDRKFDYNCIFCEFSLNSHVLLNGLLGDTEGLNTTRFVVLRFVIASITDDVLVIYHGIVVGIIDYGGGL